MDHKYYAALVLSCGIATSIWIWSSSKIGAIVELSLTLDASWIIFHKKPLELDDKAFLVLLAGACAVMFFDLFVPFVSGIITLPLI